MEAAIGKAAGQIWAYLHTHGTVSLPQLQKGTHLSARLLAMGLGWLAREGKLDSIGFFIFPAPLVPVTPGGKRR
jgi:hypothetical protein